MTGIKGGCVGKGVGNGAGMSVAGINVGVGRDVGERAVGIGVSVDTSADAQPANMIVRNMRRTILKYR